MGWKGLERNKLDYILTDLLPLELSELFSYEAFYDYIVKEKKYEIDEIVKKLKCEKAKGVFLFQSLGTMPLKYNIMKGNNTLRRMSVVQPLSALNIYLFIECYQKEVLTFLSSHNCFSIRYHKKNTNLHYKTKLKNHVQYLQKNSKKLRKHSIQQAGNYFKIYSPNSINAFIESSTWRMCNFKYKYYAKMDYKSCFDSIYTHAYKWIIERSIVDSKNAKNSNLFIIIDRILQNINGLSSNGLIVGPEFSRMMAEVLLQQIDSEVMLYLSNISLSMGVDYNIYRYVDDIFVFVNEHENLDVIIETFKSISEKYMLHLNELKLSKGETPLLPKEWIEKTRHIADIISEIFYQGKRTDFEQIEEEKRFLVKNEYINIDRLKDDITIIMKKHLDNRRTIVSYFLSTLINNISKKKDGYTLFKKNDINRTIVILDIIFFIYAFYPSFEQTRKVIAMISYVNDEFDFKNNIASKRKISKIIDMYSFIFRNGNIFDLCDWLPFLSEYSIILNMETEKSLIDKATQSDDPIIWGNIVMYFKYNNIFFKDLIETIEKLITERISHISDKSSVLHKEFWYILIFHNCPYISTSLQDRIKFFTDKLNSSGKKIDDLLNKIIFDFINLQSDNGKKLNKSFFDWDKQNNFGKQIVFRTHLRTIFKRYKKNNYSVLASID